MRSSPQHVYQLLDLAALLFESLAAGAMAAFSVRVIVNAPRLNRAAL